jgi:hypothetical protein
MQFGVADSQEYFLILDKVWVFPASHSSRTYATPEILDKICFTPLPLWKNYVQQ